jgi:ammonium transporter, Amt family
MSTSLTRFFASRYTIAAIALAVVMYVASAHPVFAQVANTTSTTTYSPPANLNSYPAAAVPSWLDTGSNSWMLTAATFVGLQSLPGLVIFYGGLSKKRFQVNTMMMVFYAFAAVLVEFMVVGYQFGFGTGIALKIGKYAIFGIPGVAWNGIFQSGQAIIGPGQAMVNVPTSTIIFFQFVFAAITPALFVGAVMERMNFKAWMIFVPLWSFLVYSPLAYWLFAGGWLNQMGIVDFSGGYVIHLSAGTAALASAIAVGPRLLKDRNIRPSSLGYVMIGAGIIWLGWNGFNGGDPYGATVDAAVAVLNTELAAASSVAAWILMDYKFLGKPTSVGAATACITGLVAITPAAGYVDGYGALIIGIAAGTIPYLSLMYLSPRLKLRGQTIDDAMGVFPAHGIAGITGGLLTGILADPVVTKYVDPGLTGLAYGNPMQLALQAFGAAWVLVYVFVVSFVLLKVIGMVVPLQYPPDILEKGDPAIHGEVEYTDLPPTVVEATPTMAPPMEKDSGKPKM